MPASGSAWTRRRASATLPPTERQEPRRRVETVRLGVPRQPGLAPARPSVGPATAPAARRHAGQPRTRFPESMADDYDAARKQRLKDLEASGLSPDIVIDQQA